MIEKTDILVVGYGNIGKGVVGAIERNPDTNLVGIISRDPFRVRNNFRSSTIPIYSQQFILDVSGVALADVAILCGGSKKDLPVQGPAFARLYNTVDSFDTHSEIPKYVANMQEVAKKYGHTSIVCAGWDPGTFSVNRILADAFIPGCVPKGFYGLGPKGGLSMGHSDAVRSIEGVLDARQYTHAIPEAMARVRGGENPMLKPEEMHSREVYVVAKENADKKKIENKIRNMPAYFANHDVTINFISQEELNEIHQNMPHDGTVIAVGKTTNGNKATIEYSNTWESNPEATANVLVACARAAKKLNLEKRIGAFTMANLAPSDLSPHSQDYLLKNFM
ncbi:MAG: diaminopimelate dehydrogenase [archaeon]